MESNLNRPKLSHMIVILLAIQASFALPNGEKWTCKQEMWLTLNVCRTHCVCVWLIIFSVPAAVWCQSSLNTSLQACQLIPGGAEAGRSGERVSGGDLLVWGGQRNLQCPWTTGEMKRDLSAFISSFRWVSVRLTEGKITIRFTRISLFLINKIKVKAQWFNVNVCSSLICGLTAAQFDTGCSPQ